ncbi:hypothetical protein BAME_10740 [Bacillus sp. M 2-6]|nr:hypothetical protein BAME_10740 [Bacillus sp. M 2-6]
MDTIMSNKKIRMTVKTIRACFFIGFLAFFFSGTVFFYDSFFFLLAKCGKEALPLFKFPNPRPFMQPMGLNLANQALEKRDTGFR